MSLVFPLSLPQGHGYPCQPANGPMLLPLPPSPICGSITTLEVHFSVMKPQYRDWDEARMNFHTGRNELNLTLENKTSLHAQLVSQSNLCFLVGSCQRCWLGRAVSPRARDKGAPPREKESPPQICRALDFFILVASR